MQRIGATARRARRLNGVGVGIVGTNAELDPKSSAKIGTANAQYYLVLKKSAYLRPWTPAPAMMALASNISATENSIFDWPPQRNTSPKSTFDSTTSPRDRDRRLPSLMPWPTQMSILTAFMLAGWGGKSSVHAVLFVATVAVLFGVG